jgi:hypothetical protein
VKLDLKDHRENKGLKVKLDLKDHRENKGLQVPRLKKRI